MAAFNCVTLPVPDWSTVQHEDHMWVVPTKFKYVYHATTSQSIVVGSVWLACVMMIVMA